MTDRTPLREAELLPCPFCGGDVKLEKALQPRDMYGRTEWWGIVCRNAKNLGGTCAIQQRPSATKEAAITRWNTRTPPLSSAEIERAAEIIASWRRRYGKLDLGDGPTNTDRALARQIAALFLDEGK